MYNLSIVTLIVTRLPHLVGVLLVMGVGIWGVTRKTKTAGGLALGGASLAALVWVISGAMALLPVWLVGRGRSMLEIAPFMSVFNCVGSVLDVIAWALVAAALFVAIRNQANVDE